MTGSRPFLFHCSGLTGLLLAGFISNACVSWYSVSSREGAAGYFVIFTAIGGGIAGFIVGLITSARIIVANYGAAFPMELGAALGVVLLISGIAACSVACWRMPPTIDGQELTLEAEFRFPLQPIPPRRQQRKVNGHFNSRRFLAIRNETPIPAKSSRIRRDSKTGVGSCRRKSCCSPSGQTQRLPIATRPRMSLVLCCHCHGGPENLFKNGATGFPRQQADGQPRQRTKCLVASDCKSCCHRRPKPGGIRGRAGGGKEAAFAAIPNDAPVQSWFPYISHEQPQTERARQLIANRPLLCTS